MNLPLKKRPLRTSISENSDDSIVSSPEKSIYIRNLAEKYSLKIKLESKNDSLKRKTSEEDSMFKDFEFPTFSPIKRFRFDEQALNYYYGYYPTSFGVPYFPVAAVKSEDDNDEEINVVDIQQEEPLSPCSSSSSSGLRPHSLSSSPCDHQVPLSPIENLSDEFHTCNECGKKFESSLRFKAHLRRHTSKHSGRYACDLCDKKFVQRSSLTTHFRIHSGERPYKCNECPESFGDFSTFTKHKRTHTGEKPYSCPVCGRSFSQSGNMHRHWKSVHTTRPQHRSYK